MPQEASPTPGAGGGNAIAIVGLVASILGILTFWFAFVGLILSVLALVFSIMGMKRAALVGGEGKGVAIAGLVVSILGVLGGGATTACAVACASAAQMASESATASKAEFEAKARAAGYDSFEEWQQKDPEQAAKASAEAAKKMFEKFGINSAKMDEAFNRAAEEAARANGQTGELEEPADADLGAGEEDPESP